MTTIILDALSLFFFLGSLLCVYRFISIFFK
jgi:hypothetical protein